MLHVHRYPSGEEVRTGDRITYCEEPGEVEFVISGEDPQDWYVTEFGPTGGIMVQVRGMGSVFLTDTPEEDLAFVGRGTE